MPPLSREFLLRRGYCCHLGCQNCPYNARDERIDTEVEMSSEALQRGAEGLTIEEGPVGD